MKPRASKLDPFAERIDGWVLSHKTLDYMQAQIAEAGVVVSVPRLSEFCSARRQRQDEQNLFHLIASGGQMNRELDAAFAQNPAPEIEQLIKVSKTLIMSLQVRAVANPELLSLANSMQQTVLNFISGQTRMRIEEKKLEQTDRRIVLLEKKAAQADETEKTLSNAELTPEEREQRIKEIYGRA